MKKKTMEELLGLDRKRRIYRAYIDSSYEVVLEDDPKTKKPYVVKMTIWKRIKNLFREDDRTVTFRVVSYNRREDNRTETTTEYFFWDNFYPETHKSGPLYDDIPPRPKPPQRKRSKENERISD